MRDESAPDIRTAGPRSPGAWTRRRFLAAGGLLGLGTGLDAFGIEPGAVRVTRTELPVPGLGREFDGLRMAHVTDVHFPGNRRAARHAAAILARERPEIVVCTGDLVEHREALPLLTGFVREARGTLATIGIFGNWERRAKIADAELARAYADGGATMLQDARMVLSRGRARLGIAGLGDALYQEPSPGPQVLDPSLSDADIWLVHCPAYADRLPAAIPRLPAALLSGHTHGGQIRLPGWVPYTPVGSGRYVNGWYRTGRAPLYVSRGVGTVEIEARFCCPPELPIFTLRRA